MSLTSGTRLGPYEIADQIGAGGMGEVYRATDTTLKRQVALKVLPDALASDAERLARFQREAEVLASLNHPNIAALYGLEKSAGIPALVMELVDGPTLADRIVGGALPIDEALAIARQIAEALETAHEQGIVHRDLKPANIKVRDDGTVKVLDFGLAKAVEPAAAMSSNQSLSPTITTPAMTQMGVILGTAAYMAPEQAKGRPADKRSDVWAFGCVLYEMLTGQRAFEGEDVSDTLAAVLRDEPDWSALPSEVSASVRTLLKRCLQRNSRERIGDAAVLLFVLRESRREALDDDTEASTSARRSTSARARWTAAAVAAAGLAAGSYVGWAVRTPAAASYHFVLPAPSSDTTFAAVAGGGTGVAPQVQLSPDGRSLVFVARRQGEYQLWLRRLDSAEARPIAGTSGGAFPFWSPDNRQVAFFAGGKLRRVTIDGGPPLDIADAPAGRGGTWNRDGVIVFAPSTAGVLKTVSSSGGIPGDVTVLDTQYGETSHRFPVFLPDGRHFLYTGVVGTCCPPTKSARLQIGSLDRSEATVLDDVESWAAYQDGHLLYNLLGTLMARPFDVGSRTFSGDPVPVAEGLATEGSRYASFSVSDNGVLVYVLGDIRQQTRLAWFDRSGQRLGVVGSVGSTSTLALSPDERRAAVSLSRGLRPNPDVYLVDLTTGREDRFTFDSAPDGAPVWSPDGEQLFFNSTRPATSGRASGAGVSVLMQKPVDASRPEEPLLEATDGLGSIVPLAWSPDGGYLMINRTLGTGGSRDVWVLPAAGDRKPRPFVQTAAEDLDAAFSADGRYVAYQSAEGGQYHVYVEAFPDGGGRRQISRDGGSNPYWRADGRELFYADLAGRLMVVDTDTRDGFRHGVPKPLFTLRLRPGADGRQYAVTRDGQRILVNELEDQSASSPVNVLVNWLARVRD